MISVLVMTLLTMGIAMSNVGVVLKVKGQGSYLVRGTQRVTLKPALALEDKDIIFSENSLVTIHIYPMNQVALEKSSSISLSPHSINLMSGITRLQVQKNMKADSEYRIEAPGISFIAKGTDFEVSVKKEWVDLDVYEGEVEASSPDVHTFVPEIVKSKSGFRFMRVKKSFSGRKFSPKLMRADFLSSLDIKKLWLKKSGQK